MISCQIKIIKSVRTPPTTKLTNKDESYYLNTDLRKIFQMPTPPMAPDNFHSMPIRAFLDTTPSQMPSMAPIWRTCLGKRKFKRRGMELKIVILEALLRAPASATINTINSKLKRALTVRRTRERQRAYQIIQAIQAFYRSMELPGQVPCPTLQRSNPTHSSQQHRLH